MKEFNSIVFLELVQHKLGVACTVDIRGFVFDMKRLQWREGSSLVFAFVFGLGAKASKTSQLCIKNLQGPINHQSNVIMILGQIKLVLSLQLVQQMVKICTAS